MLSNFLSTWLTCLLTVSNALVSGLISAEFEGVKAINSYKYGGQLIWRASNVLLEDNYLQIGEIMLVMINRQHHECLHRLARCKVNSSQKCLQIFMITLQRI
jgi:hypothetical protein